AACGRRAWRASRPKSASAETPTPTRAKSLRLSNGGAGSRNSTAAICSSSTTRPRAGSRWEAGWHPVEAEDRKFEISNSRFEISDVGVLRHLPHGMRGSFHAGEIPGSLLCENFSDDATDPLSPP